MKILLPVLVILLFPSAAFALSSYELGGTTYYSDGSSSYNLGGTTYFSGGGSAYNLGGTTYYNDGKGSSGSAYDLGGTTYYSNSNGNSGSAYNLGGTTYVNDNQGNSGSAYNLGGTTYYNGDIFLSHNCPSNSSYDSYSDKCKCSSGYVVSGSSCVYDYSPPVTHTYNYPSSYSGSTNTCPLNSHSSPIDSTKCQCDTGYQPNAANNGCTMIPIKTNNQACQDSFGFNVEWDGTKTSNGNLNCNCKTGYQWNSGKTACIATVQQVITPSPPNNISTQNQNQSTSQVCEAGSIYIPAKNGCVTNDAWCEWEFGIKNIHWNGVPLIEGQLNPNKQCACDTGFTWQPSHTSDGVYVPSACVADHSASVTTPKAVSVLKASSTTINKNMSNETKITTTSTPSHKGLLRESWSWIKGLFNF